MNNSTARHGNKTTVWQIQPARGIVLLALLVAAVLAAIMMANLKRDHDHEIETARQTTENLTRVLEEHARQSLYRVDFLLLQVADELGDEQDPVSHDAAKLRSSMQSLLPSDGLITGFGIIDAQGRMLAVTSTANLAEVPSLAARDYFMALQQPTNSGLVLGAVVSNSVTGKLTIPVGRRIQGRNGSFNGVIVASMDPAYFQSFYASIQTDQSGFVTLFSRSGWILARAPFDSNIFKRNWADSPMFREHLARAPVGTVRQVVVADGVERIYSYRALKEYPIVVSLGLSLTDSLAPWRSRALGDAALLLLLYVGITMVTLALLRQLRRSEASRAELQRISSIVESTSDIVATAYPDGRMVYLNASGRRAAGLRDDEDVSALRIQQFVTPGDWEVTVRDVLPAAEAKGSWSGEGRILISGGQQIEVSRVIIPHFDAQGRASSFTSILRNVTESKLLERRLMDGERFVRTITDSLPVRIAYVDREGRYRFVNQAHCERFGRDRSEIIGHTRNELTGGASDTVVGPRVKAVLSGQAQRFDFEEMVGGQLRRIESHLIPDVSDSGEVRGFFSTGVDITERSATEAALRELTAIIDNTTDLVVQTDWRGNVTFMNPAARRALDMASDAPVSHQNFADFNTPHTNQLFTQVIVPAVRDRGVWLGETSVYVAGGRVIPVSHMVIAHKGKDGRVERYSAVMRDISLELASRQEIQRQTETLRSVTEAIPAVVAVVDTQGQYQFVNSAFERQYGVGRASVLGRRAEEVLGKAEFDRRKPWIDRVYSGETVRFELDYPGPDGPTYTAFSYIPLRLPSGEFAGFVVVGQDMTPQKREELRLLELSERDPLTGLMNRAGFERYLDRALSEGVGPRLALLYIDLDHFKPVNDRHGHPAGDKILHHFAQRIRNLVRPTDAVARMGGDEFAIALAGVVDHADVSAIADKVIAAARAPFRVGELMLQVGASVGIAYGADAELGWRDLIARADTQLLAAKAEGRGRSIGA